MESRFERDLSRVRIHTDAEAAESARETDALAYTVGQHVVFRSGQYRPESLQGRAVLAHELAHTIQQEDCSSQAPGESPDLESEAHRAAQGVMLNRPVQIEPAASAPAVQFLRVTGGGFGKALEEYTKIWNVPDQAVQLLKKSASFMQMANSLDEHYYWARDPSRTIYSPMPDDSGRVTEGSQIGKRPLFVLKYSEGSSFVQFHSPVSAVSGDEIRIQHRDTSGFIQDIVHEAAHAVHFVTGHAPEPTALVEAIQSGLKEEIQTRNVEEKTLKQIPSSKVRKGFRPVGSRVPAEVERDMAPGIGLTYLENFFFSWRLREAMNAEKLTDDDTVEIRKHVESNYDEKSPLISTPRPMPNEETGVFRLSDYGQVWFNRLQAIKEWKEFYQKHKPDDDDFAEAEEKMRQEHAKKFFEGRVSYSALPVKKK